MTAGEACVVCEGDGTRPTILILPPLFDEANRMRRTIVQTMRALSALGVGSVMPDLPAQNDSLLPNAAASLTLWRAAVAQVAATLPRPFAVASWRGAALIDDAAVGASGWWRMAPQGGSGIVKGLLRTRIAGEKEAGRTVSSEDLRDIARRDGQVELAGYRLSAAMLDELDAATPVAVAPLRLVTPADVGGSALWLRAEPGEDPAMAHGMARDIADWAATLAPNHDPAPPPSPLPGPMPDLTVASVTGSVTERRRPIDFDVGSAACTATIDRGHRGTGLLIVSGGNEIRSGAHRGMAELAATVAGAGHPVMRFDRRGVGDSEGENGGFDSAAEDIATAMRVFRGECPGMTRVVAFGNCDAAAALLLHLPHARADALVLANIWTIETADEGAADQGAAVMPPAAAIRARYAQKLRDPREWARLLRGGVDLGKLWRGLKAARTVAPSGLAGRLGAALAAADMPVTILIAEADGTARAFLAEWNGPAFAAARAAGTARILRHPTGSHGFADDDAREWLTAQLLTALNRGD